MKGLVYAGSGKCEVRHCPIPEVQSPTEAVVQMSHTSICGTDLHILKGDVPTVEQGRILGHEGVGTITSLGSAVTGFFVGDDVLISCISSCGTCAACRKGMNSHCTTGGWVLGNVIDGTQAEYVRIPHATNSLYKLPGNIDPAEMVVFSDAFPTGMECGTLNADIQPGSSVAIVGAGPVGLAAMLTAKLYTPHPLVIIDKDVKRLQQAKRLGADRVINVDESDAMEQLDSVVDGKGFDCVIEAVGTPTTFDLCQKLVAPGGSLANIGVHGQKATLDLDKLWDHNISKSNKENGSKILPKRFHKVSKLDWSIQLLFRPYYVSSRLANSNHRCSPIVS
jgi:alcohol dehydrogenase